MYFPRRILIIDDEPQPSALVCEALRSSGRFLIREETPGARALHAARHFQPDLLLVGTMSPKPGERELAQQLRDEPALQDVPIIFITSLDADGAISSVGSLSGFSFVARSFQVADLIGYINEILCAEEDAEPFRDVA